eukprot:c9408_g1_i1.p1 GENE.c9408_g1_i1~~c9408_g1_i1.p1  ORF type:complete len:329 (+),score=65.76 c9408_g1_i1:419-1405(+)
MRMRSSASTPHSRNYVSTSVGYPVERRRFYDLMHVLESVRVLKRHTKSSYLFLGPRHICQGLKELMEPEDLIPEAGEENDKRSSLCSMSRSFVRLLLKHKADKIVPLEKAILCLHGDENHLTPRTRRLYDIANILAGVGIVKKIIYNGVKGYRWTGPSLIGDDTNFVFARLEPIEHSSDAEQDGDIDDDEQQKPLQQSQVPVTPLTPLTPLQQQLTPSSTAMLTPVLAADGTPLTTPIAPSPTTAPFTPLSPDTVATPTPKKVKIASNKKSPKIKSNTTPTVTYRCEHSGCGKVYTCTYTLNRHRKLKHPTVPRIVQKRVEKDEDVVM